MQEQELRISGGRAENRPLNPSQLCRQGDEDCTFRLGHLGILEMSREFGSCIVGARVGRIVSSFEVEEFCEL